MNKEVLLIDDDRIFHFVFTRMVKKLNADLSVRCHLNGQEALDFLVANYNKNQYFYLFLDINMPIMNGWEFLDALEKKGINQSNNVSLIVTSSSNDVSDEEKAKQYDLVNGFVTKPITMHNIISFCNL